MSCVVGCPYEWIQPMEVVARVTKTMQEMGCSRYPRDTMVGTPAKSHVGGGHAEVVPTGPAGSPLFPTRMARPLPTLTALQMGVSVVDSTAGLGGCPYAKGGIWE